MWFSLKELHQNGLLLHKCTLVHQDGWWAGTIVAQLEGVAPGWVVAAPGDAPGVAPGVALGVAPGWVEGWWPTGGSALDGSPRHSPPPRLPPKPCKQAHDKD